MAEQNEKKELTTQVKESLSVGFSPKGGLIPQTFEQMYRLAKIMSESGMMPKGLESVPAIFVAVQMGLEIGLSPMQAVQNIAPINGRPSIWGDAMLGLIRGSGLLEEFSESFEGDFGKDDYRAVCKAKRKGEKYEIIREFSIGDAKRAGLWEKAGAWKTFPKRMLQMRARSWTLRDGFADVIKGLRVAEEVIDLEKIDTGAYGFHVSAKNDNIQYDATPFKEQITEDVIKKFSDLVPDGEDLAMIIDYTTSCAASQAPPISIDAFKKEAVENWESFWAAYKKYEAKKKKPEKKVEPAAETKEPALVKKELTDYQEKIAAAPHFFIIKAAKELKMEAYIIEAIEKKEFVGLTKAECEKLADAAARLFDKEMA